MKLKFTMFGSFRLITDENTYDLELILGKQLSNVFAILVYNFNKVVSKETLFSNFWSTSSNPKNAMKYGFFRLREELNKIPELSNVEIVAMAKAGYKLVGDVEIDCLEMEKTINEAKLNRDIKKYEQALEYYSNHFLVNLYANWIVITRDYYDRLYEKIVKLVCLECFKDEDYDKACNICEQACKNNDLNEELIHLYIESLIGAKKYNQALNYYDYISKKFYDELNVPLSSKISDLFNGVVVSDEQNRITFDSLMASDDDLKLSGPLYCDYLAFKKIYQIELRNFMREAKNSFLIMLDLKTNDDITKYMDVLDSVVAKTLRINDVYTRASLNQILLLVEVNKENDEYVVVDRIYNKFKRKVDTNICRLNYQVRSIKEMEGRMH